MASDHFLEEVADFLSANGFRKEMPLAPNGREKVVWDGGLLSFAAADPNRIMLQCVRAMEDAGWETRERVQFLIDALRSVDILAHCRTYAVLPDAGEKGE